MTPFEGAIDARNPRSLAALLARVAALPLGNPREAQSALAALLGEMRRDPPAAADYLEVLEATRAPAAFLQDDLARHCVAKPLPPAQFENEYFQQVVALWQAMAQAYAQVAQLGSDDAGSEYHLALILHRCIHYTGCMILIHFRARRETPSAAWMDLHGYYATAEEWGLALLAVEDTLDRTRKRQSCAQAYATVLLVSAASPYGRSAYELGRTVRWALHFAARARIAAPFDVAPAPALGIDLMADRGARPLGAADCGESVRALETAGVARKMRRIVARLKRHGAPIPPGPGDNRTRAVALHLLTQLYRAWCLDATPRHFERRMGSGEAQLCFGFEAIHYHVSGSEFKQPEHVRLYSRDDMERIWTFRDQVDPTQPLRMRTAQIDFPLETWAVADESAAGFRLRRGSAGGRLEHGQLVCLKPPGGSHFLLARVTWLMLEAGDEICIGAHILPGVPQGVAVRQTGIKATPSEQYLRAFLLPAMPALGEPDSLILPRGWWQPGRTIEIFTDRQVRMRLAELLDQGSDFDRAGYSAL